MKLARTPTIAVVAIHGVADQQPYATVTQAVDLLRRYCGSYTWSGQSDIRIPVRAASTRLTETAVAGAVAGQLGPLQQGSRRAYYTPEALDRVIARRAQPFTDSARDVEPKGQQRRIPLELEEMRERLSGYVPDDADANYQTRRIDLRREEECDCHVFELFWADLSRLQTRVVQTLVAFFQLLFLMCDFGSRTIDYAMAHYATSWHWRAFKWIHRWALLTLVLGVPILNLALLGFGASGIAAAYFFHLRLPATLVAVVIAAIVAFVVAIGLFLTRQTFSAAAWPWLFAAVPVSFVVTIAIFSPFDLTRAAPLVTWSIAAAAILLIMVVYERRRRGSLIVGLFFLGSISLVYVWSLRRSGLPTTVDALFAAQLDVFRSHIQLAHWGLWIGFAAATLLCLVVSLTGILVFQVGKEWQDHAKRAVATATLTLAIPGALVLAVDLGLWQLAVRGLAKLPGHLIDRSLQQSAEDIFHLSIPVGAYPGSLAFLLAALFAVWLFLPAVTAESHPPKDAERLGRDLSRGFLRLPWSGAILKLMMTVGLLAGGWLSVFAQYPPPGRANDALAVMIVGGLVFLFFAVRQAGAALSSVLDVALDVANWLRHDPPGRTPCARISARFVSLLRHLCTWRDPQTGAGYDAIVVLSHSQGTVIAADLFRYLRYVDEPDVPSSRGLPVYLFTMGCPLWQLYSRRFPDQYGWARDDDAGDSQMATRPDPDELSVELWSNFYRSGDYVGRSLWHRDADQDTTTAWDGQLRTQAKRRERCIGPGAHTHYWDSTAPQIAEELDFLIGEACRRNATTPTILRTTD